MGYDVVKPVALIAAGTAIETATNYLSTSFTVKDGPAPVLKITVAGTAVDVSITLNGGTTFDKLGTLTAGTQTEYSIRVRPGDVVNFQTQNVAGITLDYFRVDQIIGV